MSKCDNFKAIIRNYIAGEIAPSELDSLQKHCLSCADCRALLDLNIEISELGNSIPEPDEMDFQVIRNRVTSQISREQKQQRAGNRLWDLMAPFRFRPVAALSVMVILLITAVFLGRWSSGYPIQNDQYNDNMLLNAISRQASTHQGLENYWDAPFSYSNISVRPIAGGRVDLSFDVSRTIRTVTASNSPLARDVLSQAILNLAPLGNRMKAMEVVSSSMDPKLYEIIIFAMHNDPEPAIRMEALSILTKEPCNNHLKEALMTTLRQDNSVQMRLMALRYLAANKVETTTLQRVINQGNMESDTAVMQYAIGLENKTNDDLKVF